MINNCISESLGSHSFVKTRKVEIYFPYVLLRTVGMRITSFFFILSFFPRDKKSQENKIHREKENKSAGKFY